MPPKRRYDAMDEPDAYAKRQKTYGSMDSASSAPTSSTPTSFATIPSSRISSSPRSFTPISSASESGLPTTSRSIGLARPDWTSLPGSLVVGHGPIDAHPFISQNMKTSIHGWRFMDGFQIPFFGVVLSNPRVYFLTTGNGHPSQHLHNFQHANKIVNDRYNLVISRRNEDCIPGSRTHSLFLWMSVRKALWADFKDRKPYMCADLLLMQRFMDEYKQELLVSSPRPRTIDDSFKAFLRTNPAFPHDEVYSWPTAHRLSSGFDASFVLPNQTSTDSSSRLKSNPLSLGSSTTEFKQTRHTTPPATKVTSELQDQASPDARPFRALLPAQPPPLQLDQQTRHRIQLRYSYQHTKADFLSVFLADTSAKLWFEDVEPTWLSVPIILLLQDTYGGGKYTKEELVEVLGREFGIFFLD